MFSSYPAVTFLFVSNSNGLNIGKKKLKLWRLFPKIKFLNLQNLKFCFWEKNNFQAWAKNCLFPSFFCLSKKYNTFNKVVKVQVSFCFLQKCCQKRRFFFSVCSFVVSAVKKRHVGRVVLLLGYLNHSFFFSRPTTNFIFVHLSQPKWNQLRYFHLFLSLSVYLCWLL